MPVEFEYITLPVAKEAALFYNNSDEKDKMIYQSFFSSFLKKNKEDRVRDLFETMKSIRVTAKANGLTPEILDEILSENDD
jgi:hypothetical protein